MVERRGVRASWVLAHDGIDHLVVPDGVVVWEGDKLVHVGRERPDPSVVWTDLPGHLVMPGLICSHFHSGSQAHGRPVLHHGRRDVFGGGFQNSIPRRGSDRVPGEDPLTGAIASLAELAKGGATTVLEAGGSRGIANALLKAQQQVPLRMYLGPGFRSADYVTELDGRLAKDWKADGGLPALEAAAKWIAALPNAGKGDGMIAGVLYPYILDYCTAELLSETAKIAEQMGVLVQTHASQSLYEFHEILHAQARTPIEWLADLGVLGPRTSLAHCFATTAHPHTAYSGGRDLEILAETGTAVAHCAVAVGRRGNHLHSLDSYQAAGIRVGIGTDTFPRDMISEMRTASIIAKVVENDVSAGSARAIIRAATTDAADFLGRNDLGRLSVGKAADLFAVNLRTLSVGVIRDPVDAMLSGASSSDVSLTIVAGRTVVENGNVPGIDEQALLAELQAEADKGYHAIASWHWTKKSGDEVFPRSFRVATPDELR